MKGRIFKRKIYEKLLEWKKNSNGRTALLIEGARRVGKSTVAEQFAKKEYDSYILVDFNKVSPSIKKLFEDLTDLCSKDFQKDAQTSIVPIYMTECL